ncbi:hypothetical protein D1872_332230 [compost metagenome]
MTDGSKQSTVINEGEKLVKIGQVNVTRGIGGRMTSITVGLKNRIYTGFKSNIGGITSRFEAGIVDGSLANPC